MIAKLLDQMPEGPLIHVAPNPSKILPNPRKSPAEAERPPGGPEREVWNLRFQRFFGYFLFAQKVTAGYDCAMTPSRGHAQLDSARPLDVAVQNLGGAQPPGL